MLIVNWLGLGWNITDWGTRGQWPYRLACSNGCVIWFFGLYCFRITYLFMCILLIWYGSFWQSLRPLQPPNSLRFLIWPQIWNQWPQLPTYPCAYCWYGMGPFWQPLRPLQSPNSLRGHIWPHIWNQWPQLPTYPCAYCWYGMGPLGSLWGHYSLQTASEVKTESAGEIGDPNLLYDQVSRYIY